MEKKTSYTIDELIKNFLNPNGNEHYCWDCRSYKKDTRLTDGAYCNYIYQDFFNTDFTAHLVLDWKLIETLRKNTGRTDSETTCPYYSRKRFKFWRKK